MRTSCLVALLLATTSVPVGSAVVGMTLDELAQTADVVVVGGLVEEIPARAADHATVDTTWGVAAFQVLKGAPPPVLRLRTDGGSIGDVVVGAKDDGGLALGSTAVLFLQDPGGGAPYEIVGAENGVLLVEDDMVVRTGEPLATLLTTLQGVLP